MVCFVKIFFIGKFLGLIDLLLFENEWNKNILNDIDGGRKLKEEMYIENFRKIFGIFNCISKYIVFWNGIGKLERRKKMEIINVVLD